MGKLQSDSRLKFKWPPGSCGFGHRLMDETDGNLWAVDKIIDRASMPALQIKVEHDGAIGSRFVYSDDPAFLRRLGDKLIIECIGHSLTEIGDVEVGF